MAFDIEWNSTPFNVKLTLVKSWIFTYFDFDVVTNPFELSWFELSCSNNAFVELAVRLQKAQNYCTRYLFGFNREQYITECYRWLKILKQNDLGAFRTFLLLFSFLKFYYPSYLYNKFVFAISISSSTVTSTGGLAPVIPRHRTDLFNTLFQVSVTRLKNSMPSCIKTLESGVQFVSAVKRWLG